MAIAVCGHNEDVWAAAQRIFGSEAKVLIKGPGRYLGSRGLVSVEENLRAQGHELLGYVRPRVHEYFVVYRESPEIS